MTDDRRVTMSKCDRLAEIDVQIASLLNEKRVLYQKLKTKYQSHAIEVTDKHNWMKIAFSIMQAFPKPASGGISHLARLYRDYSPTCESIEITHIFTSKRFPKCCESKDVDMIDYAHFLYVKCPQGHVFTLLETPTSRFGADCMLVTGTWGLYGLRDEALCELYKRKRMHRIVSKLVDDYLYKPPTGFIPRRYARLDTN